MANHPDHMIDDRRPRPRYRAAPLILVIALFIFPGCGAAPGDDRLGGTPAPRATQATDCNGTCHSASSRISPDPVATGGRGTDGKHEVHVAVRRIDCRACHRGYFETAHHMDGLRDAANPAVSLVAFDPSTSSGGVWSDDTGLATGRCRKVSCHGGDTMEWYGTTAWAPRPDCMSCHGADAINPSVINGSGTEGKHVVHLTKSMSCEVCHRDYPTRLTHADGRLDADDPAVTVVAFGPLSPDARWQDDAGPDTGGCRDVACHGTDTVDWYGSAGWTAPADCSACHTRARIDPVVIGGTGTAGKHQRHVADKAIDCSRCHADYPAQATHANGILDADTAGVAIVAFDPSNPYAVWTDDPAGGGRCSQVTCHGDDTMDWNGTGAWTAPADCLRCHSTTIIDPLATNGTGTAGKHQRHVADRLIDCTKCHAGYIANPTHMNGLYGAADPGASAVAFDATNPAGTWDSALGRCTDLACHDAEPMDWYADMPWTLPTCETCHDTRVGTRRQVLGPGGDFEKASHHVIDYGAPATQIVTDADCAACHDMSRHMSGNVRLAVDGSTPVAYDPTAPAALEPFCLGCHDDDGLGGNRAPFSDGNVLGDATGANFLGSRIARFWNGAGNTHGRQGLTCVGTAASGTGCHGDDGAINGHGSSNRGLLAAPLTLPVTATATPQAADYALCLDCHDGAPGVDRRVVLGYSLTGNYDNPNILRTPYDTPIQSLFRDRCSDLGGMVCNSSPAYNDALLGDRYLPLHNYHLMGTLPALKTAWIYRTGEVGRAGCTTCHNVHGTEAATPRLTWAAFGITGQSDGADSYKTLTPPPPGTPFFTLFTNPPVNCNGTCHSTPTAYWHTPADE